MRISDLTQTVNSGNQDRREEAAPPPAPQGETPSHDVQTSRQESRFPQWDSVPQGIKWIVIKWEPLADEPFLIVFDKRWLKDARRDHPGMGIYFPLEMRELSRHKHDVEFLRILHQTKKEFRGWIVPSSSPEYVPFEELGKR